MICRVAFHRWFIEKNQPVPGFLFFDQPSQIYFPTEKDIAGAKDEDWEAVENMFGLIHERAEELAPHLQIIVLEHADLRNDSYQDAIIERWRGERALVPEYWPRFKDLPQDDEKNEE